MTAICGGGTSSPRPGAPGAVWLAGEALQAILVARFGLSSAWASVLTFVVGQEFNLTDICNTDPPSVPSFSADDIGAILSFNPGASPGVSEKIRDLCEIAVWHTFCQCDSVSTPATPTAPTYPTDAPIIDPGGFIPTISTDPCVELRGPEVDPQSSIVHALDYFNLPALSGLSLWVDGVVTPVGGTRVSHWQIFADYLLGSGAGSSATQQNLAASGTPAIQLTAPPAGAAQLQLRVAQEFPYVSSDHISLHIRAYCGGAFPGSGTASNPCPPDPVVRQQLSELLDLVTLIQRQGVPFAYIFGDAHSGLSGAGHLDVTGLLGVKVQLDTIGSSVGVESADPDEFFQAGWITWGNADGSTKREFITHSPFVSFPPVAGQYTRLGYTFGDGVSATITELVREP